MLIKRWKIEDTESREGMFAGLKEKILDYIKEEKEVTMFELQLNIADEDVKKIPTMVHNMMKEGLIYTGWFSSARETLTYKLTDYAKGKPLEIS